MVAIIITVLVCDVGCILFGYRYNKKHPLRHTEGWRLSAFGDFGS